MGGPDRDDHLRRLVATERSLADRIAVAEGEAEQIRLAGAARVTEADARAALELQGAVEQVNAESERELARRLATDETGRSEMIAAYTGASPTRIAALASLVIDRLIGGGSG